MVGKKLEVIVKAPSAQQPEAQAAQATEAPPQANQAPAPQEPAGPTEWTSANPKVNAVIDDRVGIGIKDGIFYVTKRLEETFTPERLVEVYEKNVSTRLQQIDQAIAQFKFDLARAEDARTRAIREQEAWLPAYRRAKAMAGTSAQPSEPSPVPLSGGPNLPPATQQGAQKV